MKAKSLFPLIFKWLIIFGAVIFICRIVVVGYGGDYIRCEIKTKQNLHNIQINIERYNIEFGEYPPYLLGGDRKGWDYYNENRPDGAPYLCDPLIEKGFLESYPENAYNKAEGWRYRKDKRALNDFRRQIEPVDSDSFDPRFGLNGDKMGNVLTEPYIFVKQAIRKLRGYPRMCPGQFYYQAFGRVGNADELKSLDLILPDDYEYESYTNYVLGSFGSVNSEGKDTIRWVDMSGNLPDEFPFISETDLYETSEGVDIDIHLRLPEVAGGGDTETAPFWPPWEYVLIITKRFPEKHLYYTVDFCETAYLAPDGLPDGVNIILGNFDQ